MNKIEAWEIFDGTIASDGGVYHEGVYSRFSMSLSGNEHNDWLNLIKEALTCIGVNVASIYPRSYNSISKGKPYLRTRLHSEVSPLMEIQHRRWYSDRKKVIPTDITITPASLANWFMGDGSSYRDKRCVTVNALFCTYGFDYKSIERFEHALHSVKLDTGREYQSVSSGAGIGVIIKQDSINKFMSMIEPHMVSSFMHKIKYKDRAQM